MEPATGRALDTLNRYTVRGIAAQSYHVRISILKHLNYVYICLSEILPENASRLSFIRLKEDGIAIKHYADDRLTEGL